MFKIKQKSLRVLLIATAITAAVIGIVFILLNLSIVQDAIRKKIVVDLSQKLHTRVEIGTLSFFPFSEVNLGNVYLEDQTRDTLFAAHQLKVHLNFWRLFRKEVAITAADLKQLNFNLKVDSTGRTNFDFVVKAFASKDTTKSKMNLIFSVDRFRLADSRFRLTNIDKPERLRTFDAAHLDVRNINLNLTLHRFSSDSLSADIHSLSLQEKSGLKLLRLQTRIRANKKQLTMAFLDLKMPASDLKLKSIAFNYKTLNNLNNLMQKVKVSCTLLPSDISPRDFACFLPQLATLRDKFKLATEVSGTVSNFRCKQLSLSSNNHFSLSGNFDLNGLPDINETFVYANVKQMNINTSHLQDMIAHLSGKPFMLPKEMLRLGNLRFNGSLTGFFSEMVAYGNLSTRLGNLSTDIKLNFSNNLNKLLFSGTVNATNFRLGEMLNSPSMGNISLQAKLQGQSEKGKPFSTNAKAVVSSFSFNKYTYKNLTIDGNFDGYKFDGSAEIADPNIRFNLFGLIDISKKRPIYQFTADIQNLTPYKLNLTKEYPNLTIALHMEANLQGDLMKNADGSVVFNNIALTNKDKEYRLNNLTINALPAFENNNRLDINSDLISGYVQGKFNFIKLPNDITYIASKYLPSLWHASEQYDAFNNFAFKLKVDASQADKLFSVLDMPVQIENGANMEGNVNSDSRQLNFTLDIPTLISKDSHFSKLHLTCDNPRNVMQLTAKGMILQSNNTFMNLFASFAAAKDSLSTRLMWDNNGKETYAGEMVAKTRFWKESNQLWADTRILPTQIIMNDSAWNVRSSTAKTDMKSVWIKDFMIERKQQYLGINGTMSSRTSDSLNVDIKGIQLEYVSKMLHMQNPSLNGTVTGKVSILSVLNHPIVKANLFTRDFGLNHCIWGDTYAESSWNETNHKLNLLGRVINKKDTVALMKGGFYVEKDSMALFGFARHLPIDFLNPYLTSFLSYPKGTASGKMGMFLAKGNVWFDGDVKIENGQAGISSLNTIYTFSDSIHLRREAIILKNVVIHDAENNTGLVSCTAPNTYLKNWKFNVQVSTNNLLVMNTKETDSENFWGKIYGSGNVRIAGDSQGTNISINATSRPKTNVYISVGSAASAADNSFIDYVVKKKRNTTVPVTQQNSKSTSSSPTVISATLNVTPDAQLHLILDPKAGDKIDAVGSGILNVGYTLHNPELQMQGSYTINEGKYLFTFWNALSREFKIDKGSVIRWNGNAYNALIDINARYQMNASLADLDADILKTTGRSSIPVECLLNLTGNLMKPEIKFDIDLPNSREEVKRAVKSVINTNDMMNRQMIWLLAFNRFYNPDYRTSTNPIGQNELMAVASSTLSNQLNSWLSQAISGFNVGFNLRQSGLGEYTGTDYEANIMYQNNRWVINGNVGYRNDNFSTSKFIGDVDIQYILSNNGKWRVRGYNRTNDYKQLNPAPYTQGLGFSYTENFNSFKDLMKDYWEAFKAIFRKKKSKNK
ncbi:MAG: hypothetical protein H6Q17_2733 [Bacteroidetes bacterium]|nr:hypothetical protein [Bacteroidota bacterium]